MGLPNEGDIIWHGDKKEGVIGLVRNAGDNVLHFEICYFTKEDKWMRDKYIYVEDWDSVRVLMPLEILETMRTYTKRSASKAFEKVAQRVSVN